MSKTLHWGKEHPIISLFLAFAIIVGLPLLSAVSAIWYSQQKMIDYTVDTRVENCESSNRGRAALIKVVERAADPPPTGAAAVSMTTGPEYEALPPETQQYLQWLEKEIANQPDGSANLKAIAEDLKKNNPANVNCEKVGKDLRKELESGWL